MPLFSLGSHPRHLCGLKQCSVSVQQAKSLHFNMSHLSEGELTSAVISSFPTRRDPEEQKKKKKGGGRRKKKKGVDILTLSRRAHSHAWVCCVNVLRPSSAQSGFLVANFQMNSGVAGIAAWLSAWFLLFFLPLTSQQQKKKGGKSGSFSYTLHVNTTVSESA